MYFLILYLACRLRKYTSLLIHTVTIIVNNTEEIVSEILQLVYKDGLQIESIAINPPSLEEVFLSVVNAGIKKEKW